METYASDEAFALAIAYSKLSAMVECGHIKSFKINGVHRVGNLYTVECTTTGEVTTISLEVRLNDI